MFFCHAIACVSDAADSRMRRRHDVLMYQAMAMKNLVGVDTALGPSVKKLHGYAVEITPQGASVCDRCEVGVPSKDRLWLEDAWANAQIDQLIDAGLVRDKRYWDIEYDERKLFACAWVGVTCAPKLVVKIDWNTYVSCTNVHIGWLPGTVEQVHMRGQRTIGRLVTRQLPKSIQNFALVGCNLSGPVDFMHLPRQLLEIDLRRNAISGAVWLIHLPTTLHKIYLSENEVEAVVVANQTLPKDLKAAYFERNANIEVICVDETCASEKILIS